MLAVALSIVSLLLPSGLHVILVTSGIVVYVKVSLMNQMIQFISVENVYNVITMFASLMF